MRGNESAGRRWTFVVGVGLLLAALTISSAVAGPKFLTPKKAFNLFAKKTDVYTKAEADGAFARKGDSYMKAEDDAKFTPLSHTASVMVGPANWVTSSSGSMNYGANDVGLFANSGTDLFFHAALTLPQAVAGKSATITNFEMCYEAGGNVTLDRVSMSRVANITTASIGGAQSTPIFDDQDRTDDACRTYAPASPVPLGPNDLVQITARVDYAAPGAVTISKLLVHLNYP